MTTLSKLQGYLSEIKKNDKKGNKINAFLHVRDEKTLLREAEEIDAKIKSGMKIMEAKYYAADKFNVSICTIHRAIKQIELCE